MRRALRGRRGVRARGRALQGERGRATLLEAGEDLPRQPARDRDHDAGRLRARLSAIGLGAELELLHAAPAASRGRRARARESTIFPDSFMAQSALQTADSVSRGFLAREAQRLAAAELELAREPEGVTMPPPGLVPPPALGAAAGGRVDRPGARGGRARRRCPARRARGPRRYVRRARGRCSTAATCTAPRHRRRACTRSRRPASGELKPKAAAVAVVLPDGPESIARVGGRRVDGEAPRHARASVARGVGLRRRGPCRCRRRARPARWTTSPPLRVAGQRLDRGAGDARARVELDDTVVASPSAVPAPPRASGWCRSSGRAARAGRSG